MFAGNLRASPGPKATSRRPSCGAEAYPVRVSPLSRAGRLTGVAPEGSHGYWLRQFFCQDSKALCGRGKRGGNLSNFLQLGFRLDQIIGNTL